MSRKTIGNPILRVCAIVVTLLTGCAHQVTEQQYRLPRSSDGLPGHLANRTVRVADLPVLGDRSAALALIEVTDYQCPYCQTHHRETLPLLKKEFIDSGQLAYYVLDYPLPGHEFGELASVAVSCAHDQQAFWQYHDRLFDLSKLLSRNELLVVAEELALDSREFEQCFDDRQQGSSLDSRRSTALKLGVQGTPTFLLGRLRNGRIATEIAVLPGLQTIEYFRQVIDRYQHHRTTEIPGTRD